MSCTICVSECEQFAPHCDQCRQSICIDCYATCDACPFCRLSHLNWFNKVIRCQNSYQVQRLLQLYFERATESQNKFTEIANRFVHNQIILSADLVQNSDSDETILDILTICRDWLFYGAQIKTDENKLLEVIYQMEELKDRISDQSLADSFFLDVEQVFDILDEEPVEYKIYRKFILQQIWNMQKIQLRSMRAAPREKYFRRRQQQRQLKNYRSHKSRNGIRMHK